MIGAKIAGVIVTEIIQVVVVSVVALLLHWRPHGGGAGGLEAAAALLLGSAGCAGIGLLLAGSLRAEVNLAAANGLYLVLLLMSGIVVPLSSMPAGVRHVALYLPSGAMADTLHQLLGHGASVGAGDWWSLGLWALVAPLLAARTFRFD
jgi:ABC-2 type transport system permease protein